jgi:hypothetical protein
MHAHAFKFTRCMCLLMCSLSRYKVLKALSGGGGTSAGDKVDKEEEELSIAGLQLLAEGLARPFDLMRSVSKRCIEWLAVCFHLNKHGGGEIATMS